MCFGFLMLCQPYIITYTLAYTTSNFLLELVRGTQKKKKKKKPEAQNANFLKESQGLNRLTDCYKKIV